MHGLRHVVVLGEKIRHNNPATGTPGRRSGPGCGYVGRKEQVNETDDQSTADQAH